MDFHDFHIPYLSRLRFLHTVGWAILMSALVVAVAATLARATLNLAAALTDKPDLAVFVLLQDDDVTSSVLLRESTEPGNEQRDYLVETKDGPKLVQLKKAVSGQWYVALEENLHE
ncbi:MAG: hypothetical protein Greene041619_738 [Candidatus Peregrinibacteria bacterium Greene0416_19]|nr:MAG: hypothetical protein Greene041619_738 [Candidatus Peregrinibacteria bacterium Greene0416_19]